MKVTTTKYKDKATGFVGTLVTTESHQGCTAGLYCLNGDTVAYVPNHSDPYFLTVKLARAGCLKKAKKTSEKLVSSCARMHTTTPFQTKAN